MEENVDFGQLHQSFGPSVETTAGTSAAGSPRALNNGPSASCPLAAPVALDKEAYAPAGSFESGTEESKLAPQSHQEDISLQFRSETNIPNREEMTRAKEEAREAAQLKTYTRWLNSQLKDGTPPLAVNDLIGDLRNGVVLINLLHILYGVPLPQYHRQPNSKIHALDNMAMAFNMLEQVTRSSFPFLKPANVVDGDQKMVMGLLWTLILDSGVRKLLPPNDKTGEDQESTETSSKALNMQSLEQTANSALLSWCRERTQGYEGVDVQDFTESFADGLAFNALLHSFDPSLVEYRMLDPANKEDNLRIAFSTAEHRLGIPQLLDVSDFREQHAIDSRSVITYLSQYVKCFASPPVQREATHSAPPIQVPEQIDFPQPGPPLPPRLHAQQHPVYDPPQQPFVQYPPGYGLAPPQPAYNWAPPYQAYPACYQQNHQQQKETGTIHSYKVPKKSKGKALVERAYLW